MTANVNDFLKSAFVGAAALTLVATPMASAPSNAFAQSAQVERTSSVDRGGMTQRQALIASQGRVVLYYGSGITGVEREAATLTRHDVPATAVAGYPADGVRILVNGKICGSADQREVYDGTLSMSAKRCYDDEATRGLLASLDR